MRALPAAVDVLLDALSVRFLLKQISLPETLQLTVYPFGNTGHVGLIVTFPAYG
jgi:hypothetical protein